MPRPITHPLAIAWVSATPGTRQAQDAYVAWAAADRPLYADPTPLPAPALGMRVWSSWHVPPGKSGCYPPLDIDTVVDGAPWDAYVDPAFIDVITDFRTGEVLWRRA